PSKPSPRQDHPRATAATPGAPAPPSAAPVLPAACARESSRGLAATPQLIPRVAVLCLARYRSAQIEVGSALLGCHAPEPARRYPAVTASRFQSSGPPPTRSGRICPLPARRQILPCRIPQSARRGAPPNPHQPRCHGGREMAQIQLL